MIDNLSTLEKYNRQSIFYTFRLPESVMAAMIVFNTTKPSENSPSSKRSVLEITPDEPPTPKANMDGDGGGPDDPPTLVGSDAWPSDEHMPHGRERDEIYRKFARIMIRTLTSDINPSSKKT